MKPQLWGASFKPRNRPIERYLVRGPAIAKSPPAPFLLNWGPDCTKAAMELQKAVLESYQQMSRVWLERTQSEVSLWSGKASTTPEIAAKPRIR